MYNKAKIREALEILYRSGQIDYRWGEHMRINVDAALSRIEAELPRWIPVGERLPDIDPDDYLVVCRRPEEWVCEAAFEQGRWILNLEDITNDVTHWQPLPPAPEKEGSAK